MGALEGEKSQVEEAEPTPTEGAEPTEPKEEPTVDITKTEGFRKEFDKALGKSTASLNQQITIHKKAADAAKAEVGEHKAAVESIEAERQGLQEQYDDLVSKQFADDPDAKRAYTDRRAIAEEKRELAKGKAEVKKKLYEAEVALLQAGMGLKAQALATEIPGLDPKELIESCNTEAEMEIKALRFKLNKEPEKKEKEPKFDSGVSSGGGLSTNPTVEQLEKASFEVFEKWAASRYK